jgi:hypothetical protein
MYIQIKNKQIGKNPLEKITLKKFLNTSNYNNNNNNNSNNINDGGGGVTISIVMRLVIVRRDYSRYNNMINITAKTDMNVFCSRSQISTIYYLIRIIIIVIILYRCVIQN